MAEGNPYSFLHIGKPEIDLPAGTDPYADAVYAKGKENFTRFIREKFLLQDKKKCFYIYKQVWGEHVQIGLVAGASCQDYQDDVIKKHELTREDKEKDRQRHIETLDAQTGPVFLTYKRRDSIDRLVEQGMQKAPITIFRPLTACATSSTWSMDEKLIAGPPEGIFEAGCPLCGRRPSSLGCGRPDQGQTGKLNPRPHGR